MTIDEDMTAAGWYLGRQIPVEDSLEALHAEGYEVWPQLITFLQEFAGLTFRGHVSTQVFVIDVREGIDNTAATWGAAYSRHLGRRLAPVGAYSHMTIYLADPHDLLGGFDSDLGLLGPNLATALDGVLNHHPTMPQLTMRVGPGPAPG